MRKRITEMREGGEGKGPVASPEPHSRCECRGAETVELVAQSHSAARALGWLRRRQISVNCR